MRAVKAIFGLLLGTVVLLAAFWFGSQWWEKAFAPKVTSEISPDGCYRLEQYRPYWLFPHAFHPQRAPDRIWNPLQDWYGPMLMPETPGFVRLYDQHSGRLLVETEVYDLTFVDTGIALRTSDWYTKAGGSVLVRNAGELELPCQTRPKGTP